MRRGLMWLVSGVLVVGFAVPSLAQLPPGATPQRKFVTKSLANGQMLVPSIMAASASGATIPLWSQNFVAPIDGLTYSATMVGRNPYFHGHRATHVQAYLVPVKLTFASNGSVFDPTTNDGCTASGTTVLSLTQNSPLFQNSAYTMNGAQVGTTQYVDAYQRANFWSVVQGLPYHIVLDLKTLPAVSVTVPRQYGSTSVGLCQNLGLINISWWEPDTGAGEARTLLTSLAAQGVGPNSLPIFLLNSAFFYQGTTANCCILGYHDAFSTTSGAVQTYSTVAWDDSQLFGGDISSAAHEVGEWMDDPLGTNLTPNWGHVGQVTGCLNLLENGDPLSGTYFSPVTLNGFSYSPQELAFVSWFYRQSPSIGSGGLYSNNGTFTIDAGPICK